MVKTTIPFFRRSLTRGFLFMTALVLVNFAASYRFTRFDLSSEKRFSLSPVTRRILDSLSVPVKITLYLDGEMPPGFKRLKIATEELLAECAAYSHGKLTVEVINPVATEDASKNDQAVEDMVKKGMQPLNLEMKTAKGNTQKLVFAWAWVAGGRRAVPASLLQNQNQLAGSASNEEMINNSIENLEFQLVNSIHKVTRTRTPGIGFLEGNGEYSGPELADIIHELQSSYRVARVPLHATTIDSLLRLKMLVMVKPQLHFSESDKYKLDQYLMRGGKLLLLIDNLHADLDSMGKNGSTLGFPENLNLDDMLFKYGIRINYNLVKDLECAPIPVLNGTTETSSQQKLAPWVYYPVVMPASAHPLVRNLDPVRLEFANSMDTIASRGIRKTILLSSSEHTRLAGAPVYITLNEINENHDQHPYNEGRKAVSVLLEGRFRSVFINRSIDSADKSMPFLGQGLNSAILVVSDGDIIKNQVNTLEHSIYPLGYDKYTRQLFGNKTFLLNVSDYLAGEAPLISLRSKQVRIRLLDKEKIMNEKTWWQGLNTLLPLLLIWLSGILISLIRKWRFKGSW